MPQYWHMVEALVMLARHVRSTSTTFTRAELVAWSPAFQERPTGAQHALNHLAAGGFVRRIPRPVNVKWARNGTWTYTLTAEGLVAAKAAREARAREARAQGMRKVNATRPRATSCFAARLWSLLRMRTALSAADAAQTLVDAGADVERATRTASSYLRAWARSYPDAIKVSAKPEPRGAYRFVLVRDLGPTAPTIKSVQERAAA
jgi:hypothetical protein